MGSGNNPFYLLHLVHQRVSFICRAYPVNPHALAFIFNKQIKQMFSPHSFSFKTCALITSVVILHTERNLNRIIESHLTYLISVLALTVFPLSEKQNEVNQIRLRRYIGRDSCICREKKNRIQGQ